MPEAPNGPPVPGRRAGATPADILAELDRWRRSLHIQVHGGPGPGLRSPELADQDLRTQAVIYLMLRYNVNRLRTRKDMQRLLHHLGRDLEVIAMEKRVSRGFPLVMLKREEHWLGVALDDLVECRGLFLTGVRRIRWQGQGCHQPLLAYYVNELTGLRVQEGPEADNLLALLISDQDLRVLRKRRWARNGLRRRLNTLYRERFGELR